MKAYVKAVVWPITWCMFDVIKREVNLARGVDSACDQLVVLLGNTHDSEGIVSKACRDVLYAL